MMNKFITLTTLLSLTASLISAQLNYEKSLEAGYSIGMGDFRNNSLNVAFTNGFRINNSCFTGIGIGFGYSNALNGYDDQDNEVTEFRTEALLIPIFIHLKVSLSQQDVSPFLLLNAGFTIDINQYLKDAPGFFIMPALGCDIKLNKKQSVFLITGFNLQHNSFSYTHNTGSSSTDWEITEKSILFKSIDLRVGLKF